MLTILNFINYLIGKPLSSTMLVSLSIIIYALIITTLWDYFVNNPMYLIIIIILLILDIASIIVFCTNCVSPFSVSSLEEEINVSSDMESDIKCDGGECKIKKKKIKKIKKIKKDKIPLYDGITNDSINTYK